MSIVRRVLKPILANTVWRQGSVRRIFRGPCRGLRYRIFPDFGLAPLYGGWEADAQSAMVEYLSPGQTAYDIGANFGIHVLLMARLVGNEGKVYAFEPVPTISADLRRNIALNNFKNVEVVEKAVDEQTGRVHFERGHHDGAGHVTASGATGEATIEVPTISLDEFVFEGNHRSPDLIKIDVEGAESRVLEGARRVLEASKPTIIIDLHNPEQDRAVGRILSEYGYRAYRSETRQPIEELTDGWPNPKGLWGQCVAVAR